MITFASLQKRKPLSEISTFGIGGPARFFVEAHSGEEMKDAIRFCHQEKVPFLIVGKGSNCLFHDNGFDGLVILNRIDFIESEAGVYHVGAGYSFSLLGTQTARSGWTGLEFASGIPGTVGGAVFMNAGANQRETQDVLSEVEFVNEQGEAILFKKDDLIFGYRFSSFHRLKGAIISAKFILKPCTEARENQLALIQYRLSTQPYSQPSAGCVFRNPPALHSVVHNENPLSVHGLSAGALIERSGLKGLSVGGAVVSEKHANFILNQGYATAADVLNLIQLVKQRVKEKTGVELEQEIRVIPYNHEEG